MTIAICRSDVSRELFAMTLQPHKSSRLTSLLQGAESPYGNPASHSSSEPSLTPSNSGVEK